MTTNDIDIDAIRQREQAATEGPWTTGADETWSDVFPPWTLVINANHPLIELESGTQGVADAEFIAAARTDVPALLAKVAELTAELAKVREQLTAARCRADGLRADERSRGRAALTEYRDANHRHHHRVPGYCICGDDWDDEGCTEYVGLTEAAQLYTGERAEATR